MILQTPITSKNNTVVLIYIPRTFKDWQLYDKTGSAKLAHSLYKGTVTFYTQCLNKAERVNGVSKKEVENMAAKYILKKMEKGADLGAMDTEPLCVLNSILSDALKRFVI